MCNYFFVTHYSYSFVYERIPFLSKIYTTYNSIFVTSRNGMFNGFPLVALGALVANRKERLSIKISALMAIISLIFVVVESFLLKILFKNIGADTVLFLLPFTFFFLEFTLATDLKDRKIYKTMRNLSLLIFVSQRLFLPPLPSALPPVVMETMCANSYLGLIIIVGVTVLFSLVIINLSDRFKFLRVLWA